MMHWHELTEKLSVLKDLVVKGYLDNKAADAAVTKLLKQYEEWLKV